MARKRKPDSGRLEVRILRRLPVDAARLRRRAAGCRRRRGDRQFRGSLARGRERAVRSFAGRRLDHHGARCGAHPRRFAAFPRFLVTIGACATAGGIQALRNFKDVKEFISIVYAAPEYIETLNKSTPISDHVRVDFELRGCPINKQQLLEVISAFLLGRKPNTPPHSVCIECKRRGTVCVMVASGTPCLGPVTHAAAARFAPPTSAAATAASDRRKRPTRRRSPPGGRPRCQTRQIWSAPFAASTLTPSRSAERAKPMKSRTIKVDYAGARGRRRRALDQDPGRARRQT